MKFRINTWQKRQYVLYWSVQYMTYKQKSETRIQRDLDKSNNMWYTEPLNKKTNRNITNYNSWTIASRGAIRIKEREARDFTYRCISSKRVVYSIISKIGVVYHPFFIWYSDEEGLALWREQTYLPNTTISSHLYIKYIYMEDLYFEQEYK